MTIIIIIIVYWLITIFVVDSFNLLLSAYDSNKTMLKNIITITLILRMHAKYSTLPLKMIIK